MLKTHFVRRNIILVISYQIVLSNLILHHKSRKPKRKNSKRREMREHSTSIATRTSTKDLRKDGRLLSDIVSFRLLPITSMWTSLNGLKRVDETNKQTISLKKMIVPILTKTGVRSC